MQKNLRISPIKADLLEAGSSDVGELDYTWKKVITDVFNTTP